MRKEQAKTAKSGNRKAFLALYIVVLVVLIVVLVLTCVKTSAGVKFSGDGITSVQVLSGEKYSWEGGRADNTVELIGGVDDERIADVMKSYKDATTFSVGYGIMNNLWSFKPTASDMEPKTVSEIKDFSSGSGQKMVVLSYDEQQTATIEKTDVVYDRAFVFVTDSDKRLITYSVYLIDESKILANSDTYTAQEYRGYINGTKFYNALSAL